MTFMNSKDEVLRSFTIFTSWSIIIESDAATKFKEGKIFSYRLLA